MEELAWGTQSSKGPIVGGDGSGAQYLQTYYASGKKQEEDDFEFLKRKAEEDRSRTGGGAAETAGKTSSEKKDVAEINASQQVENGVQKSTGVPLSQ